MRSQFSRIGATVGLRTPPLREAQMGRCAPIRMPAPRVCKQVGPWTPTPCVTSCHGAAATESQSPLKVVKRPNRAGSPDVSNALLSIMAGRMARPSVAAAAAASSPNSAAGRLGARGALSQRSVFTGQRGRAGPRGVSGERRGRCDISGEYMPIGTCKRCLGFRWGIGYWTAGGFGP